ncbi:high mobility group protein DSP1-like [Periplaneta americana]|uniref:high mobility group protein DSP1-like n=1 Tax=Periplaneta americana TaxID=6978 RepID=UPI0037E82C01
MFTYSVSERVHILKTYIRENKSYDATRENFRCKFPGRPVPSRETMLNLVKRFNETGSVNDWESRQPRALAEEKLDEVGAAPRAALERSSRRSRRLATMKRTMLDKEKKRSNEMAETEMEGYTPPKSEKTHKSLTAFFWFCSDERSKIRAQNPEFGVPDIAMELARRWSVIDPELKSKYEAMAEKDKAKYDRASSQVEQDPVSDKQESEDEDEEEEEEEEEDDRDEKDE